MVIIVNIVTFENYKKGRKSVDRNAVVHMTAIFCGIIWHKKVDKVKVNEIPHGCLPRLMYIICGGISFVS